MPETPETLLEETFEFLDALASVVQRSIDALKHDPNPLLQHLIQQEIEHQKDLLQQIEKMKERLHNHLSPPEPDLRHDKDLRLQSYPPGGALGVTLFGRKQIRRATAAATFVDVIEKVGIESVKNLDLVCRYIPLIDSVKSYEVAQKESGDYYITVDSSTSRKITILNDIAESLDVDLIVDHL